MKGSMKAIIAILIAMTSLSCSNTDNPSSPSSLKEQNLSDQEPLVEATDSETPYPHGIFGAWEVSVNPETLTAEIIPARNASAIGNIFDADLLQFLTISPCANCLQISGLRFDGANRVFMDIYMKHPFSDITKRPDLHGFDVRAIFIGSSTGIYANNSINIMKPNGDQPLAELNPYFILNADGFTSHYDEIVTDTRYFIHGEDVPGNLNPYLRFFEDYTAGTFDPKNPKGYNVMATGAGNYLRTAVLNLYALWDTPRFYIVADVAFGQSAVLANRQNPQYYLPSFNRTEPWRVEYWIENNNLSPANPNSTADVVVQVFDWQQSASVDPSYPNPSNLSGVRESSKVAQVELNAYIFQSLPVVSTTPEAGDGSPTSPLRYRLTIKNENTIDGTSFPVMIAVRDELHGDPAPSGRLPIPPSPAGFPFDTQDIRDYSYYGVLWVNIPDATSGNPEYDNELLVDGKTRFGSAGTSVDVDFFMDPSHKKFQYRWDYNYDGTNFDLDGSGLPSPWIEFASPGVKNAALRVRTNSIPPQQYIYEIPLYAYGKSFDTKYGSSNEFFMSRRGSNAVAAIKGRNYYAFTQNFGTDWSIMVGYFDSKGTSAITSIPSGGSGVYNYDPAIAVVEDGPDAGVYVTYMRNSGSLEIYSWRGSLDLTTITDPTPVTSVSGYALPDKPCLIYNNGNLNCYFEIFFYSSFHTRIYKAQSIDLGASWLVYGEIDGSSVYQYHPSAAYSKTNGYTYVVWEDQQNPVTTGADIYMAVERDGDGLTFDYVDNLSFNQTLLHEEWPSVAAYGYQVCVAYLERQDGFWENNVCLLVSSSDFRTYTKYLVNQGASNGYMFSAPSVAMGYTDRYTIAYVRSDLSTYEIYSRIDDITTYSAGDFAYTNLEHRYSGFINPANANMATAVACYTAADGNAIVSFAAHQTYEDGFDSLVTPFSANFGEIIFQENINYGKPE